MNGTHRKRLFWSACAGIFMFGLVLAILGTLFGLPEMRERLGGLSLAQQGDVFLALFFGVFLATLVAGPSIDSFGNKVVLTLSAALVTAALASFAAAESFPLAALAAFVLGFGGGGLNTSTNALVAELYAAERGAMLNILGVFFGFGALFMPLVAASVTDRLTIPQLLLIGAALAGATTVVYLALSFPPPSEPAGFSLFATLRVARFPGVLLFAMILFFQSGNESSIGGWVSTYLGSIGASPRVATWVLAGYWAALMFGRLLSAWLLRSMTKASLVLASAIGSTIGVLILLVGSSVTALAAGAVVAGLSFAAIYPTVLAMAADRYQRLAGTVFGLLFAVGLIGGMTFPWALGHVSERWGLRAGMVLPLFGAIMIALLVGVVTARSKPAVAAGG
ncbi:MAG TPA: MFS transporter [Thermoanaerobaculia bacterium]|nr:MFS transporter [Thermoanaerobaculia bacterium]